MNKILFHNSEYEDSEVVFMGVPLDYNVSFRKGSAEAADKIRDVSDSIETFSLRYNDDIEDVKICDVGNIKFDNEDNEVNFPMIYDEVSKHINNRKWLFSIGGDHSVAWPIIKAHADYHNEIAVFHFDAHADLREEYEGNYYSHATPMHKVAEYIGYENCYAFGIRSAERAELENAKAKGYNLFPLEVEKPLADAVKKLKNKKVYVTFDIDVFDPAFAPGTGTLEMNGTQPKEILNALEIIKNSGVEVIGCDIVEVAPPLDSSDMTSLLAANLIREFIINFFKE